MHIAHFLILRLKCVLMSLLMKIEWSLKNIDLQSKIFKVYLQYTCSSSTLTQSNILQYIFSWIFSITSAQLKCIKHKISCSNLADFNYTSIVY